MLKRCTFRLYPNKEQQELFAKNFGCCRWIYNWGLEKKIRVWGQNKKYLSYFELSALLPNLKNEHEWLGDAIAQSLQCSLEHLDRAFKQFFKEKRHFPRFKKKGGCKDRFEVPQSVKLQQKFGLLSLPKIKNIKIIVHRPLVGKIKTTTIIRTPSGKFFASILVETPDAIPTPPRVSPERTIGIDLGVTHFLTTSNGTKLDNPRHLSKSLKRLKVQQHRLSRRKAGSKRRGKQRLKVAKLHERVRNQRQDFLHKVTHQLTHENQVDSIVVENLAVQGMLQKAPTALSRSISDVGWYTFIEFLKYKCSWYGKNFIQIGQFEPSSKICSACGAVNRMLRLEDRTWTCSCGIVYDRDVNAAINIKNFGLHPKNKVIRQEVPESTLRETAPLGASVN